MIYIFNLFFSIIWIKFCQNKNKYLVSIPFLFWSLMIGFQYDVGVDYFNYFSIFGNASRDLFFLTQKEYGFYIFLKILRILRLNAQTGFLLISIFSNYIFYLALLNYKKYLNIDISIFIFLYFTLTTIYVSQMNGLRQYIGIYLFFLSGIYLIFDKKKYFIMNILGGLIHSSLFIAIPIYFFRGVLKKNYKTKILISVLFFSLIISLIDINLKEIFLGINSLGKYSYYLKDPLLEKKIDLIFKITKLIYFPLYIYSILLEKKMLLTKKNRMLYNLGIFSYSIKLISLVTFLTIRISEIFNFFMIFPIYYLVNYLKNKKKYIEFFIIILYLLLIFFIKYLIIPSDEINYTNYLFVKL